MAAVKYENFNKIFFMGQPKIKWFDRKGLLQLSNGLMATITLSTHGTHAQYEKYVVEIKNKNEGTIDSNSFLFSTYFGRKDNSCYSGCKIIEHCCQDTGEARWYIEKPTLEQQKEMVKAIFDYIKMYQKM